MKRLSLLEDVKEFIKEFTITFLRIFVGIIGIIIVFFSMLFFYDEMELNEETEGHFKYLTEKEEKQR